MEWIRGTELEDIRYLNKSTDEEWKIVKNFILCGGCNSLEEKIICYKNMLENHDWYETSLVDAISTNDIIAEAVGAFLKFIFLLAVFADKMPKVIAVFLVSDIILYRVVNKIISIKKHKEAKTILSELENQLKEQVKDIYQRDDEIIREISSTLDTIAQVKYPGYQSDLYELQNIAHQYVIDIKSKKILTVAEKVTIFKKILDLDIENKIKFYQRSKEINYQIQNIVDRKLDTLNIDDNPKYDIDFTSDFSDKGQGLTLNRKK